MMTLKRTIILSLGLILIVSAAMFAYYRRQAQPFTVFDQPQSTPIAECVRVGCGGQLCVSADLAERYSGVTTCETQPEHQCYQQANCRMDRRGKCSFETTPEIRDCLQQVVRP